jgi:hypothetical protein
MTTRWKMPVVWLLVGIVVGSILTSAVAAIVRDDFGGLWRKDFALTLQLVGYESETIVPNPEDLLSLIDAIQVYRQPSGSEDRIEVKGLINSAGSNLIFETQNKERIRNFIRAAMDLRSGPKDCNVAVGSETYHALAFDHDLLRTAHLPMKFCESSGTQFLRVEIPTLDGGSSIAYNKSLADFFLENPHLKLGLKKNQN